MEYVLEGLPNHPIIVSVISVILNIVVAISGVFPSAAITAGNIVFFGFKVGLLVSIIGEAAGAIVSFILYRKGLNKIFSSDKVKNRFLHKLKFTRGLEAVLLVLLLRIFPFVPSGVVTLAAAYSQMRLPSFIIASTVGKVPSIFIEAYSVDRVLKLSVEWQIGIGLGMILFIITYMGLKRKRAT